MFLMRDASELAGRSVQYWVSHFLSCDNSEREDAMKVKVRHCTSWNEALALVEQVPWCIHPEWCEEGDVPWRINNFFSSGDLDAADVMLDAAWEAYGTGSSWLEIIEIVEHAEKVWRRKGNSYEVRDTLVF